MKVSFHQAEHLPWLGLLDKIANSDLFILGDELQYKKNYFENRNKIKTHDGYQWITVPVESSNHKPINKIKFANQDWKEKYLKTVKYNYNSCYWFEKYYYPLKDIVYSSINLFELNYSLLKFLLKEFEINTPIILMSELTIDQNLSGSDKCLEVCKQTKTNIYLAGKSGQDYLDLQSFKNNGIKVEFHNFFHPIYKQRYLPFNVGMSSLDLLMNYGFESKEILLNSHGDWSLFNILKKIKWNSGTKTLEMFSGMGSGHAKTYAVASESLDMWEIYPENVQKLKEKYPNATIKRCNSLEEIHLCKKQYELVICDNPATICNLSILPFIDKILDKESWFVIRTIKKLHTPSDIVKIDPTLEETINILKDKFEIIEAWEEPREYHYLDLWLSNYVFKLKKKDCCG